MQTSFTLAQLADPQTAESEKILRACVHCGFCTATCPTYVLLGDELDSPRGRIYLIKEMLENSRPATADVVKHVDRCLSCLSCMTTCPSGVHYMHLVDHGRAYIEKTYRRPWEDRLLRSLLANVLPYPARFRAALALAWTSGRVIDAASWFTRHLPGGRRQVATPTRFAAAPTTGLRGLLARTGAMLSLAPARLPGRSALEGPGVFPAVGPRRGRVALLSGCAQQVLGPSINEATIRLLTRHGIEVVLPRGEGCCGALVHHMGREHTAMAQARNNIDVWCREADSEGLDAILITASGCGTTVKDYGFMFRTDATHAAKAARVSALTKDISEYLAELNLLPPVRDTGLVVAYHAACSLQHGQKVLREPKQVLGAAGFTVQEVPEGHLCCGSAGTYNMLQPDIAAKLRDRKVANIMRIAPDVIATGNIGCMTQIGQATQIPIVHTVELIDWATGGPTPDALKTSSARAMSARANESM